MRCIALLAILLLLPVIAHAGVPAGGSAGAVPTVHVFNWQTYIDKDILQDFRADTGIAVAYSEYDDNSILDARVMRRQSGFDVVVPSAEPWFAHQIKAGAYQPLDKDRIPNLSYLDPQLMKLVQSADPDNKYGIIYQWGTTGVLYNVDKVAARLPGVPLDSWNVVFKPENMKKLKDCGVAFVDSPIEVYPLVFRYLGIDPNTSDVNKLAAAERVMTEVRPYIKYFHSSRYIDDLATGHLCAVVGYSGDYISARDKAAELDSKINISYFIPKEGSMIWFDMAAIPVDAPNPDAANRFINYVLQPKVMAKISNTVGFANAVPQSDAMMDAAIKNNPLIYPPEDVRRTLFLQKELPDDFNRALQQSWSRMRASNVIGPLEPVDN